MASEIYIVAYDGEHQRALDYAAEQSAKTGAALHIVHVLEWSPYRFLTPQELDERHMRRNEEMERGQAEVMAPVLAKMADKGITATGEIRYGNVVDLLSEIAQKQKADCIVMGRSGGSGFGGRIFGSSAMGLVQVSPVPVTIVP